MKNGDVVTVKVTDDSTEFHNLNGSATSITADLKSGTDINYDTNSQMFTASVTATFNIPTDTIKSEKNYYLELDDDIVIPESALNIKRRSIDPNEKKESFEYWFEKDSSGKYVLKISYLDDYLNEVEVIGKNTINIDLLVKELEEEGTDHKKFNFTNDLPIVVDNKEIHYPDNDNGSSNISVEKTYSSMGTGTKDGKTVSYIDYTVTVSSTKGTGENITLTDTMSSLNAQYNWWQNRELSVTDVEVLNVAATGEGTSTDYTFTKGENNDSFTMELSKINAAGSYTITYRYYLDKDLTEDLEDGDTRLVASGSNRAVAETSKIHDSDDAGFTYTKTDQPVEVGKKGTYDESTKKITWTITLKITKGEHDLYDEAFANASNLTITREEGDDFTTSQDGNTIHFNNPGTYTITYTTDASTQYMYDAYKVNNQALVDDGQYKSEDVGVDVPVDGTGVIEKQLVESELVSSGSGTETYNTTWYINFTLPDVLPAGTILRDTLTYSKKGDIDHKFTEEQKNALISNLEDIFGNNVFDVELNDIDSGHELVLTLKNDWTNTTGKNSVSLTYTTTSVVDLDAVNRGLSTQTNADKFTNRFSIDDVSASADFSYRKEVNKIDPAYRDGTKVTSHNITRENNGLKWEIVLNLSDDYNDMIITDTLPSGLTVTKVEIGGEYNLDTYSNYSESGNTRTFTYDGGNHYIANNVTSITAEKSDTGTNLVVSLHVDETHPRSSYFEEGDQVHMIVYADVDENEFAAVSDLTKSYTNTVSVTGDGKPLGDDDQTQKTTLESSALSKSEVELTKDEWKNYHYLSYQVPINLDGHAMLPEDAEDNTYSVDDVVSFNKLSPDGKEINFMLVPGSVKLQTKNGNDWVDVDNSVAWSYQYIESKDGDIRYKTISVSGLPDNTVLRLIYTYEVDLSDTEGGHAYNLGDITNSATVHGETDRTITIHTHKSWEQFSSDASTESSYTLTLSKVDLSDYNKLLPGTKFVLEKYQGGKWIVLDAISQESQYLSTENDTEKFGNGATLSNPSQSTYQIYVTSSSPGNKYGTLKMYMPTNDSSYSGSYFESGICYRVREYEAPAGGYVISSDPEQQPAGYFWFSKDHNGKEFTGTVKWPNTRIQGLADDLSTESDTFYITNAKQPSLKITKKIIGDAELSEEQLESLIFTVYNSVGEEVGRLTYKDILKNKNVISNDKIINGQTYTVKETGIDAQGVTWTATYTVNTDDEQTATGTETVSSSTQINVGEVEIVNNVGTVAITNKYDSVKTSIKATKEWVDYEGQTVTNPSSKTIQFQVYQMKEGETEGVLYIVNGAEEAETHTISFDETTKSWDTTTVNELPKYYYDETGNLKEYSYYVVETAPTAHLTTTYKLGDNGEYGEASSAATDNDNSTIVIKNVEEEPPHFEVTKNWVDSDGVTDYTAKTSKNKVYFKVFVNWDWFVYNPVDAGVMEENSSVYNTDKKYFIIDKVDNGSGSYSWETIDVKFPHNFKPNGDTFTSFWIQEVDENGNAVSDVKVTYTVDDVTEAHPIVVTAGNGNLGSETITNREKDKLTVKKVWIDGQDHSSSPDKIQFHLYRRQIGTTDWQPYKEWQELKPGEGWEKNYSGLEEGYEYKVEELYPSPDYTVSYSTDGDKWAKSGDTITITNTKKVSETSVAVQKIWDVKDNNLKNDVTVKLMQTRGIPQGNTISAKVGIEYQVTDWQGAVNSGTNYSDSVSKIVGDGDITITLNRYGGVDVGKVLINGSVVPSSRYSVQDDDGNRNITITGINSSVDIEIIHNQVYNYDSAKYTSTISISGEPASSIVQDGNPLEYGSYTLKASENWYHEWPELPATNTVSGTTYVYSYYVVEAPVPDGFSVSYSTDNGDTWKDSLTANDAVSGGKTYQIKNTEEEPQYGSLKITKSVQVGGQDNGTSNLTDGTYSFTVYEEDGTTIATKADNSAIEVLSITLNGGVPTPSDLTVNGLTPGIYVIKETGSTNEHMSMVTEGITGYDSEKEGIVVTVTAGNTANAPTAAFVNDYEMVPFEFTKEWHDTSDQVDENWRDDITVTVQRRIGSGDAEIVGKYTIHKGDSDFSFTKNASTNQAPDIANESEFTFKITDLPKNGKIGSETGEYTYFVTEETVSGYRSATYSNPSTSGGWISSNDGAYNGGKIINTPESSYELPSTGGHGALPLTGAGALLLLLAGTALTVRKLLIQRNTGKGGGSE